MQYLGRAKIFANGVELDTENGAKLNLGGIDRKERVGAFHIGYVEKLANAMLECEIGLTRDTPISTIKDMTGATIQFQTDVGLNFVVRNAFFFNLVEMTEGDGGKIKIVFKGNPAEAA